MAGIFQEGVSKVLSGVYSRIVAAVQAITQGTRGVVAYPFTSNWGPVNVLTEKTVAEFKTLYNAEGTLLTANKIYKHASKANPNKIKGYRMATNAAAVATAVLQDSLSAMSLTLATVHPTDRPFVVVVKTALSGAKVVEISENSVLLASVSGTTVTELEAELNKTGLVIVTAKGSNLPANIAGVSFAGGNNGAVVTATEYGNFLTELEADGNANAFALDGIADEGILTAAETWVRRVRTEGNYITFTRGMDANASVVDANTKSRTINHRGIVNVGNGADGYSAAEMAIFVAARVASVALNGTVTDEVTSYTAVNKKLLPSEREAAKKSGTLVFVMDGDQVLIDEGVNTLTTPPQGESAEFGKIRISNTLDQITKDLEKFGTEYKRNRSNTAEARQTYAATVESNYLAPLAAMEVIQPGYFYREDPEYHGKSAVVKAKIDEAYFHASITPIDSMEKLYQKIGVNF